MLSASWSKFSIQLLQPQDAQDCSGSLSHFSFGWVSSQLYVSCCIWDLSESRISCFCSVEQVRLLSRESLVVLSVILLVIRFDECSNAWSIQNCAVLSLMPVSVWRSETGCATPRHANQVWFVMVSMVSSAVRFSSSGWSHKLNWCHTSDMMKAYTEQCMVTLITLPLLLATTCLPPNTISFTTRSNSRWRFCLLRVVWWKTVWEDSKENILLQFAVICFQKFIMATVNCFSTRWNW